MNVFVPEADFLDGTGEFFDEMFDAFLDDDLRGAGPRSDENGLTACKPFLPDFGFTIDQKGFFALGLGKFGEPATVGTVLASEDQDDIGQGGQLGDGFLAIRGGVADVVFGRGFDRGKSLLESRDHSGSLLDAEGGLRQVGYFLAVGEGDLVDFLRSFDEEDMVGGFPHRADDFVVSFMSDEDDAVTFACVPDGFDMDFGDEGAGGIDRAQSSGAREFANFGRDSVGAVEENRPFRDVAQVIDERDSLGRELIDHMLVVNDFMIDVDVGAEATNDFVEGLDRHIDPGAETTGVGQKNFHRSCPACTFECQNVSIRRVRRGHGSVIFVTADKCGQCSTSRVLGQL